MKVSKTVSIDLELLRSVLSEEKNFSAAVTEALEMWLAKKVENEKWTIKEEEKASLNKKGT